MSPTVPLGAYPHERLCGQVGMTPTRIRMTMTRTIAPNDIIIPPSSTMVKWYFSLPKYSY